jgi:hypothetical protein
MVLFMLGRLSRPSARRSRTHNLRVLFSQGAHGDTAQLKMSLGAERSRLRPADPDRMALFSADDRFKAALAKAWDRAGKGRIRGKGFWSLEAEEGPIPYVTDESLGAAFAVLLDEVHRTHRAGAALRGGGRADR